MTATSPAPVRADDGTRRPPGRRVSSALARSPRTRLVGLLTLPAAWLVLVYLAALFALLATAFLSVDEFTNAVTRTLTLANAQDVVTDPAYLRATLRTVGVAAAVTVLCAVIAMPMAFFMAKVAPPRARGVLVALVVTPLWASYLVKVYAWQALVQPGSGVLDRATGGHGPGYAGLERLPDSLIDASSDLGAGPWRTVRSVVLPLVYPSLVAGSVFTFSLSLGDYITVQIVGGKAQLLANIVFQNYAANLPFAAAIAIVPVLITVVYLSVVRRTGALDNL
jgi:putative spermidine/putrescine transport system permease protein